MRKPINFLRVSPSYVAKANNSHSNLNHLDIGDAVIEYLTSVYSCKEGLTYPEIARELSQRSMGIVSRESVRRTIKQLEYSFRWLNGTAKEKELLLKEINSKGKSYRRLLRKGIECLRADNIFSWSQIVSVLEGQDEAPGVFQKEINNCSDFRELYKALVGSAERIKELFSQKERSFVECFDEVNELKSLIHVNQELAGENKSLTHINQELMKENESLKERIKTLEDRERRVKNIYK